MLTLGMDDNNYDNEHDKNDNDYDDHGDDTIHS